jgi:hypothetical protein
MVFFVPCNSSFHHSPFTILLTAPSSQSLASCCSLPATVFLLFAVSIAVSIAASISASFAVLHGDFRCGKAQSPGSRFEV